MSIAALPLANLSPLSSAVPRSRYLKPPPWLFRRQRQTQTVLLGMSTGSNDAQQQGHAKLDNRQRLEVELEKDFEWVDDGSEIEATHASKATETKIKDAEVTHITPQQAMTMRAYYEAGHLMRQAFRKMREFCGFPFTGSDTTRLRGPHGSSTYITSAPQGQVGRRQWDSIVEAANRPWDTTAEQARRRAKRRDRRLLLDGSEIDRRESREGDLPWGDIFEYGWQ
ncbi:hypothetical protein FDECE_13039 [Fusarium decemcellulare]|nr:hypothetical protein FDECE_13039 [Fusarium decemcellulare]